MWKDKLFWFSQPALALNNYDKYFLWMFAGLVVLGVILKLLAKLLTRHPVGRKLWNKFGNASASMGLIGLLWFGIRYENTPIFSARYWAAVVILILLVWVFFIIKFLFTKYGDERNSYDRMQLNSKYIPGPKR
jgi:cell division protein FtsW (lipid II flippase)